ncbi:MAG: HEPN domain-containing protein [Ruminococcus sp.]|nr:HEPN domain-containing protein [Ruminococcus sp.]
MSARRKYQGTTTFNSWDKCKTCKDKDNCNKINKNFTFKIILMDCEGFYYIFKELEKFVHFPTLTGDIEKYEQKLLEYEKKHENIPDLNSQMVVNGTLAVELALKSLLFKENGEFECIHNLEELFGQLPEPHKSILTDKIYKEAHQNAETMASNLSNISNLFEKFRYVFECDIIGYSNFLNNFIHIVCDYAISLKPKDDADNIY